MSTEYFNDQWRMPSDENQNKVSNYSMEFNGTSDYVDLSVAGAASVPSEASSWTFSAWIWLDSGHSGDVTIFERGATYPGDGLLVRESNGRVQVYSAGTNRVFFNPAPGPIPTGQWTYFALVYDQPTTNLTCYVNTAAGAFSGTNVQPAGWAITGTLFNIGKRQTNANYWKGKMDQVSVFDYALPATGTNSIATLYGGGTTVVNPMSLTPIPVAYYQLGDQSAYNGANYLSPNSSLQPTSGYSPYALDLDGVNDEITIANGSTIARQQNISYSLWVNTTDLTATQYIVGNNDSSNKGTSVFIVSDVLVFQIGDNSNDSYFNSRVSSLSTYVNADEWFHIAASWDGTDSKIYINGIERNSWTPSQPYTIAGWSSNFIIGRRADTTTSFFEGKLSNIAFWNSGLSAAEVTEIYNQGVPSNLNTFSGTAPISWWQLGSNSSFNTNWTCLDEIGTNNGTSANMTNDDITNGPGYSANGLGTSSIDILGDAPYSTSNALSENMDVLNRSTEIPS